LSQQILHKQMKLENILGVKNLTDRKKVIANIQYRGNWFFSLFNQELKPYDLSEVQFNVLRILKGKHPQPLSSGDIINLLVSQASDVTRIVDRLVKKGLVKREIPDENRRMVLISLTENGLNKVDETKNILKPILEKTNVWTNEEIKILNKLLDKLD
jgi:MarR family transcriptional regulator, 2-MHQ and catechol-resistance regulon repressor